AHLADLRRTRSGPFRIEQAMTPVALEREAGSGTLGRRLIPALGVLGLPALRLSEDEIRSVRAGIEITASVPTEVPGTRMARHDAAGDVVAILELRPGRRLRPLRVMESFAGPS